MNDRTVGWNDRVAAWVKRLLARFDNHRFAARIDRLGAPTIAGVSDSVSASDRSATLQRKWTSISADRVTRVDRSRAAQEIADQSADR